MATTLNTVARSNLRASKGKYVLTGIGIAIASFFIAAIMMLTNSLQATLNASTNDFLSKTEAVVTSAVGSLESNESSSIYLTREQIQKVQQSDLLSDYWVQYAAFGVFGTGDQKTQVQYNQSPTNGVIFPYKVEGKFPSNDREIMVSTYFAKKHNLALNGKVTSVDAVVAAEFPATEQTAEYTVVGLFDPGFEGSTVNRAVFIGGTSYGEALQKIQDQAAKSGSGGPVYRAGGATYIFLKFKDGVTDAKLKSLREALSTGNQKDDPRVVTGEHLMKKNQEQLSSAFAMLEVILGAFAALALLVSSFVISNTFAVLVGQRIRELALLRTLGARGGSLVKMLLVESVVVGLVFSLIGALLIYPVGMLVGSMVSTIMISYSITPILVGVLLCTLVTVLASLVPARTALRISPISAMSERTNLEVRKPGVIAPILGLIFAVAGIGLTVMALSSGSGEDNTRAITWMMFAALLLGIAVFLITPWVLIPLVRLLGLGARTQTGQLALANALRSPKRTVSTGRAVLVGTLVVSMVLTGYSVLSASLTKSLDQQYPISAMASFSDGVTATEDSSSVHDAEEVFGKVKGIKNIEAAALARAAGTVEYTVHQEVDSMTISTDMVALSDSDLHAIIPEETTNLADGRVLVPSELWKAAQLSESSRLKARGPLGELELKPIKSQTKQSLLIVNPATGAKLQDAKNPVALVSPELAEAQQKLTDPATKDDPQVKEAALAAYESAYRSNASGNTTLVLVRAASPLTSTQNSDLQDALKKASPKNTFSGGLQLRQVYDQVLTVMLSFTLVMLLLSVVISIIGVANTMTLSVNERRRENAMLRSLGLSRKQLRRMISTEAILITLAAVVLGIVAGGVIGALSAQVVMAGVSSNAPLVLDLPYLWYVVILVVGVLAALAASALPAMRSARMSPVQGMRG